MTQLFDVSGLGRLASPRHRKVRLRGDWVEILALVLRVVGVGLLSAVGWIHVHLWQTGYRHVPTIGPLFLAAAVSAFVVGAGLLARPSRLMGLSGIGLVMGVLTGLIVSVNVGLFGFEESLSAPFSAESIVLEIAAAVTLAAWMAVDFMKEGRQTERTGRATSALSLTERHSSVDSPARIWGPGGSRRHHGADRWQLRARRAEDDAEQLARALDFHVVNDCDCLGPVDMAAMQRHESQAASPGAAIVHLVRADLDLTGDGSAADQPGLLQSDTAEEHWTAPSNGRLRQHDPLALAVTPPGQTNKCPPGRARPMR